MRQKQVLPPFNGAAAGRYAPARPATQRRERPACGARDPRYAA